MFFEIPFDDAAIDASMAQVISKAPPAPVEAAPSSAAFYIDLTSSLGAAPSRIPASSSSDKPTLCLQKFAAVPTVDFGEVVVGQAHPASLPLHISNPTDQPQTLLVTRYDFVRGLSMPNEPLLVEPGATIELPITWQPEKYGAVRLPVEFKLANRWNLKALVIGRGVESLAKAAPTSRKHARPAVAPKSGRPTEKENAAAARSEITVLAELSVSATSGNTLDIGFDGRAPLARKPVLSTSRRTNNSGPKQPLSFMKALSGDERVQMEAELFTALLNSLLSKCVPDQSAYHVDLIREKVLTSAQEVMVGNLEAYVRTSKNPRIALKDSVDWYFDHNAKLELVGFLVHSYSPVYIRVALEALYRQRLPEATASFESAKLRRLQQVINQKRKASAKSSSASSEEVIDEKTLQREREITILGDFIEERLLYSRTIEKQFGFQEAPSKSAATAPFLASLRKYSLYKVLLLIWFCDRVKSDRLIPGEDRKSVV